VAALPERCDVLVIGGGPAGATIAALLAQQGRDVVLLEKAHHPRFHIGESLLPSNAELFDQLGVRDAVERIGMPKFGIEFVSPDHAHRSYVDFSEQWDKSQPYAWQVRRADLDEILFRNAERLGAKTVEGCRVHHCAFDDEGATVHAEVRAEADGAEGTTAPRSWHARFVVDASGRDTFLANKLRCKAKSEVHNSSALFAHYTGARRLEGTKEGNISLMWFPHGWFWFIPLADGTTSVGAVCWPYYLKQRDKPLPEFFADTIALSPEMSDRLKGATLVDGRVHATGNYSYSASHSAGERYVMLGDAYTFIDPMFSSGVYLAMRNAFDAVPLIETSLDRPAQAARARRRFEARIRKGPREFLWFIVRATNPTIRDMFMHPANPLRAKEALLSMLAGDLYGKTPIRASLWVFKAVYYGISLANWRRTLAGMRRRRVNIAEPQAQAGEAIGADTLAEAR
jgi:flavin-dependent dehydrogenase